jgi:O-antigen ligase
MLKHPTLKGRIDGVEAAAGSSRTAGASLHSTRRNWALISDVAGLALLLLCMGWIANTSHSLVASRGLIGLLAGCAALFVVSRLIGAVADWVVPAALVALAAAVVVVQPETIFDARPVGGLFDYSNARAAFFVQAAAGAAILVELWRPPPARLITLGAATIFSLVPFLTGTHAGMIAVGGLVAVVALRSSRSVRLAIVLAGTAFVLTLCAAGALAARYEGAGSSGILESIVERTPLHEHRVELWHEALLIMLDHPVSGVGLGGFAEVSELAQEDVDSRYARNEFMQFGAETGVVGFVLLTLLFLWGFFRLYLTPRPNRATAIAAVALAALGMHASVDYVLHFPAVPLAAVALVGIGISTGHRREAG